MPKPKAKFASKDDTKVPSKRPNGPKFTPRSKSGRSSASTRRSGGNAGPSTALSVVKRGSKREIVFDPEARKNYLRGFSERKRQRRAFGLAMQKVKDRKAKIDQRAQERKDELARVEEAERQKEELMEEVVRMNAGDSDDENHPEEKDDDHNAKDIQNDSDVNDDDNESDSGKEMGKKDLKPGIGARNCGVLDTKVYDDKNTASTWGGHVTVTTSVVQVGDGDDSEDELPRKRTNKSTDVAQKYAGNVQKYLDKLKGQMPNKKKGGAPKAKRKGRNGAADMQGMGGAANLKVAQKLLSKSRDTKRAVSTGGKRGKKGKR